MKNYETWLVEYEDKKGKIIEKTSRLYRKANWYRPLYTVTKKGDEVQLSNIVVYDEKGIIVQTGYGYFDNDKEITIKGEIIRKRKEDFTKKENYILRFKEPFSTDISYVLCIYRDNVNIQFLGFEKTTDRIMAKYDVNGGELKSLQSIISMKKYRSKDIFEELANKIATNHSLPMDEEELEKICKELIKANKELIEEEKKINDFRAENMEAEAREIMNRLKGRE